MNKKPTTKVVRSLLYALLFVNLFSDNTCNAISSNEDECDHIPDSDKENINSKRNIPNKSSSKPTEAAIAKARSAIRRCQVRNLQGTHPSEICLLKTQFITPDILGPVIPGDNFLLLHGPTGNGKTSIAQNIAEEVKEQFPNSKYIEIDCSAIKEPYENEGVRYLQKIFDEIKNLTDLGYKVIILFDELDSITAKKERDLQQKETAQFFGGFLDKNRENHNLLIIATTNIYDQLMPQVKSRFLNTVKIDPPNKEERISILQFYNEQFQLNLDSSKIESIANETDKLGRRSLKNIVALLCKNQNLGINTNLTEIIEKQKKTEKIDQPEGWSFFLEKVGTILQKGAIGFGKGLVHGAGSALGNHAMGKLGINKQTENKPTEKTTTPSQPGQQT